MSEQIIPEKTKHVVKKAASTRLIIVEIFIGLVLSLSALGIFAGIADEVLESETYLIDILLSQLVYDMRTPWLTEVMQWITRLGYEFMAIIALALLIFLLYKRYNKESIIFIVTVGMGAVLNIILKVLYQRPRPDVDPLMNLTSYSFPSGHAMNAFIFYSVLAYLFYHFTRSKKLSLIISLLASSIILLVGFSRVYLGVHYPSDVIAGFVAGLFVFITTIVIERTLTYIRLKKQNK